MTPPPVSGNPPPKKKGNAVPVQRSASQQAALDKQQAAADLTAQNAKAKAADQQLAQIVNLLIAGHSYESIAAGIGASADDVEKMVTAGAARFVRTQPALRTYVRNFVGSKITKMIEVNWAEATDPKAVDRLANQDRVLKMLDRLAKLHGADAPIQSEVKVEAAPETVEAMVKALAARQGQAYDENVFDVDTDVFDVEVLEDAAQEELDQASADVEVPQPDDEDL